MLVMPVGGQPWTECRSAHREAGQLGGTLGRGLAGRRECGQLLDGEPMPRAGLALVERQGGSDQKDRQPLGNLNLTWKYVAATKFVN